MSNRKKETVSRAFAKAWPEFAEMAKQHDILIAYSGKAFWADGNYQLTGFTTIIKAGVPHVVTQADVEERIRMILGEIIEGRAKNAVMTPRERFGRAVAGLATLRPRAGMISSWGDPGGDTAAACGWRGMPDDFRVTLAGIGEVARADAPSIGHAIPLLWDAFEAWEARQ